ncbi:MAG: acyl-CoA synthetase [Parahaliea sp.]
MQQALFPALCDDNHDTALIEDGRKFSYAEVNQRVNHCATGLLGASADLEEQRIAFFLPASLDYVTVMHGVWRAGGIAVPLNVASAVAELEHYLGSAGASRLITTPDYHSDELQALCDSLGIAVAMVDGTLAQAPGQLPEVASTRRAMMLFTSGTTSKPKGVVHTHHSIASQITCLIEAWAWTTGDIIPLFLPVHHVHGIINVLSCGLWAGATVELFSKFDSQLISQRARDDTYTVFMAVPTIYVKLIQHFTTLDAAQATATCQGFSRMRLNISGSAACPVPLFEQWRELTGQVLLERYGMTEIGMAISNPYHGERRAGCVGQPLPGVDAQLFGEDGQVIGGEGEPGEIRIRGGNLFLEYWNNEAATRDAYDNGWFCTGDMAVVEDGYFRIMGRTSIDIIKSGGYKLSALEIEGALLEHEAIAEVAVIGVADDTWGEAVAALVVLKEGHNLDYGQLKSWCDGRLSGYKIPKHLKVLPSLPRNAMGKVIKPSLKSLL